MLSIIFKSSENNVMTMSAPPSMPPRGGSVSFYYATARYARLRLYAEEIDELHNKTVRTQMWANQFGRGTWRKACLLFPITEGPQKEISLVFKADFSNLYWPEYVAVDDIEISTSPCASE